MAKKQHKRVYEPLQKIIVTKDQIARIGYVVADRNGVTGIYGKGQWQIRVAFGMEDAKGHRNSLVSYDYVMPYSDEMWAAFQRLEDMKLEVGTLFHELRKGRIPAKLQPVVQGAFSLVIENDRPSGRE